MLNAIGVDKIYEAKDGASGLEAIQTHNPDIVLLDWEMPGMNGAEFMRQVRSPTTFMYPAVPIIMLTGHSEKSRVMEAVHLGVHEFLLKPVSSTALLTRIVGVLSMPRPDDPARQLLRAGAPQVLDLQAGIRSGHRPADAESANDSSQSTTPNFMIFGD